MQGIWCPEFKVPLGWAGGRGFAFLVPPAPAARSKGLGGVETVSGAALSPLQCDL